MAKQVSLRYVLKVSISQLAQVDLEACYKRVMNHARNGILRPSLSHSSHVNEQM